MKKGARQEEACLILTLSFLKGRGAVLGGVR